MIPRLNSQISVIISWIENTYKESMMPVLANITLGGLSHSKCKNRQESCIPILAYFVTGVQKPIKQSTERK